MLDIKTRWHEADRVTIARACYSSSYLFCQRVSLPYFAGTGLLCPRPRGKLGFMLYIQTFGDLVTFNPHVHALVADGVFYPSGSFRVLPPIPEDVLREGLRHRLLEFLCNEAGFDPELAQRMLQWRHSGFSVHNQIRVKANDAEGRKQLARYMIRNPFALEKMTYDGKTGMVISIATIKVQKRIASPEMLPCRGVLPHLKCSPRKTSGDHFNAEGEHDGTRRAS